VGIVGEGFLVASTRPGNDAQQIIGFSLDGKRVLDFSGKLQPAFTRCYYLVMVAPIVFDRAGMYIEECGDRLVFFVF
jgi:hypothetical protein